MTVGVMEQLWMDQLAFDVLHTMVGGICKGQVPSIYLLSYHCTAMEGLGRLYSCLLKSFAMDATGTVAYI